MRMDVTRLTGASGAISTVCPLDGQCGVLVVFMPNRLRSRLGASYGILRISALLRIVPN